MAPKDSFVLFNFTAAPPGLPPPGGNLGERRVPMTFSRSLEMKEGRWSSLFIEVIHVIVRKNDTL